MNIFDESSYPINVFPQRWGGGGGGRLRAYPGNYTAKTVIALRNWTDMTLDALARKSQRNYV